MSTHRPQIRQTGRSEVRPTVLAPLLVAAGCAAGAVWVGRYDPEQRPGLFVPCPINAVTGLRCPACGGTRMAHHLVHGRLRQAWRANPVLLVGGLPTLGCLWLRWYLAARDGEHPAPMPRKVAYGIASVAATWTVARNLAKYRRGR